MDSAYYKEYYIQERNHWWFKARMEILKSQVLKFKQKTNIDQLNILNVGVATGATSKMLEDFGHVVSVEYDSECCAFLRDELKMEVIEASLTELPFEAEAFDLICAFDVIEHIEDDMTALSEIRRVMKPYGFYAISVPAFQFLWGAHDVINHHFRRYTRAELNSKIRGSEMNPSVSTYFNFWLFLPIAIVRVLQNLFSKPDDDVKSDFEKYEGASFADSILYRIFKTEKALLKMGVTFPFGVSILSLGQKNKPNNS